MSPMVRLYDRLSRELRRRVLLMVGRAVLTVVDDSTKLQTVQVQALAGEVLDGCERFQSYGFTSHPRPGSDAVVLSVGGVREHPLILSVEDRERRLTDLAEGEVAVYGPMDNQYIKLKADGSIEIKGTRIDLN